MYLWITAILFSRIIIVVKNLPANAEDVRDAGVTPGSGRSPGGGHGNPTLVFLPGESPWIEKHGGLQSTGLQRVRHNCTNLTCMHYFTLRKMRLGERG